jgi:hypothetical protein
LFVGPQQVDHGPDHLVQREAIGQADDPQRVEQAPHVLAPADDVQLRVIGVPVGDDPLEDGRHGGVADRVHTDQGLCPWNEPTGAPDERRAHLIGVRERRLHHPGPPVHAACTSATAA